MVNNKVGVSQRKIGNSLKVDYTTVGRTIKKIGLKYRKRCRAPKATEAQKGRQVERLEKLCQGPMSWADDRDIVMDDESYLTLTGAGMPGNMGFYTNDIESCPEDVKFRYDEKFPGKVMVHCSISKKGFSQLYVAPRTTTMDGTLYTAYRGWSIQKKFLHPKTKKPSLVLIKNNTEIYFFFNLSDYFFQKLKLKFFPLSKSGNSMLFY